MKIDQRSTIILAAAGVLLIAIWLILPVYSFTIVIPLFLINGFMLAFQLNQFMALFLLVPILLVLAPLSGQKKFCVIAGGLSLITCLLLLILKKPIIMNGNLKWLFQSAGGLIRGLGSFLGVQITENNLDANMELACNQFLLGGLGLWLSILISFVYLIFSVMFVQESVQNSAFSHHNGGSGAASVNRPAAGPKKMPSSNPVSTTPTRTSHRT